MKKNQKITKIDTKRRKSLQKAGRFFAGAAALAILPSMSAFAQKKLARSTKIAPSITSSLHKTTISGQKTIIEGSLGVGQSPSKVHRLVVKGSVSATEGVYNAMWGDLAEFRLLATGQKAVPGKAYVVTEKGLMVASKKAQLGSIGICSDTFGFALGGDKKDKNKAPIAISGWVLAYVDRKYKVGTAVVSGKNGVLTKAGLWDRVLRPERILGIVENSPAKYNDVKINGRFWVKI